MDEVDEVYSIGVHIQTTWMKLMKKIISLFSQIHLCDQNYPTQIKLLCQLIKQQTTLFSCARSTNFDRPINELDLNYSAEIMVNLKSVLQSFGIPVSEKDMYLPFLYWIPKLHKTSHKQRYIAGSGKCSTSQWF